MPVCRRALSKGVVALSFECCLSWMPRHRSTISLSHRRRGTKTCRSQGAANLPRPPMRQLLAGASGLGIISKSTGGARKRRTRKMVLLRIKHADAKEPEDRCNFRHPCPTRNRQPLEFDRNAPTVGVWCGRDEERERGRRLQDARRSSGVEIVVSGPATATRFAGARPDETHEGCRCAVGNLKYCHEGIRLVCVSQ